MDDESILGTVALITSDDTHVLEQSRIEVAWLAEVKPIPMEIIDEIGANGVTDDVAADTNTEIGLGWNLDTAMVAGDQANHQIARGQSLSLLQPTCGNSLLAVFFIDQFSYGLARAATPLFSIQNKF